MVVWKPLGSYVPSFSFSFSFKEEKFLLIKCVGIIIFNFLFNLTIIFSEREINLFFITKSNLKEI